MCKYLIFAAISACSLYTKTTTASFELPAEIAKQHKNSCKSCENKSCPEDIIPLHGSVTHPSKMTMERLNEAILLNFEQERIKPDDLNLRVEMMEDIRKFLAPKFPYLNLTLFGSTINGWGLRSNTDVDICLTSLHNVNMSLDSRGSQIIDGRHILEKVASALSQSEIVANVGLVPAKTPIVEFTHLHSKLDGDLVFCSNNNYQEQNAMLLNQYSHTDIRVRQLGLFLKKVVKPCRIAESINGGLASVAWVYMLIYFLQRHDVPVVPVMKEPSEWDGYGKNRETVAELWLAFLNFYVEMFDHENVVVAMAKSDILLRTQNSWYTDGLAIEDPIRSNDVGIKLNRKMTAYIMKTLQNLRHFFHRSADNISKDVNFLRYYLDARNLRKGNPPVDLDKQCQKCVMDGFAFVNNCTTLPNELVKRI